MPKNREGKHLTHKQKQTIALQKAHGKSIVLSIGISDYNRRSGFEPLKTCSNDAMSFRDAFLDVWQLNADKNKVIALTSGSKDKPSKGIIIQYIKDVVSYSGPDDRIIVYYSGHGHKIKNDSGDENFYLVPQDAYDDSDPEALIDFRKILHLINKSEAKQKIIFLDACLSGPDISGKKLISAKYSRKFLTEYMEKTKGSVIITSSTDNQSSYTQSPNPKLSLFTHYLTKALRGDIESLDDSVLTINSLFEYISAKVIRRANSYQKEQTPTISCKASGVPILADFSQSLIAPERFDLEGYPISELEFKDFEYMDVKDVLTNIRRWTYSQEYLESKVNSQIGDYLEEDFGRKAGALRKAIGCAPSEIDIEDTSISFPGGIYDAEYIGEDKRSGKLIITLSFGAEWFGRPNDISEIIDAVDMSPNEMVLDLENSINPESVIPGLEARGWEITSQLRRKIEAKASNYELIIRKNSITFKGFLPEELFGDDLDKEKSKLASNVLFLIGS